MNDSFTLKLSGSEFSVYCEKKIETLMYTKKAHSQLKIAKTIAFTQETKHEVCWVFGLSSSHLNRR